MQFNLSPQMAVLLQNVTDEDIREVMTGLPTLPETGMRLLGNCPKDIQELVALAAKLANDGICVPEIERMVKKALVMHFGVDPGAEFLFVAKSTWQVYYKKDTLAAFREALMGNALYAHPVYH